MRIEHVYLKNYRCFDSLSVDLHPQMTVLVAPNGQGKTSVLDAIKVALWPYVAGFDLGSTTNDVTSIQIDDVRREQVQSHEMDWRLPAEIKAMGQLQVRQLVLDGTLKNPLPEPAGSMLDVAVTFHEDVPWQGVRYRESVKKGTKTKEPVIVGALNLNETAKALEQRIFSGEQKTPDDLPMLGYYGTGRLWAQKKLTSAHEKADSEASSRTFAYRDCLDPASSYKHFAQWYTRIFKSFRAAQIRNLEKRLPLDADVSYGLIAPIRAVQLTTDAILGSHTGWRELEYSEEHEELVLTHEQYGQLKVSQLSDGIRNMLALVGDIAYRCYKLNAHHGEAAPLRTHGIVLIDEVDMHLHPGWQQTVLTDLITAFPKLQFIVTTHSAQVLTTIPSECIRILRDNQIYSAPPGTEGAEPERMLKQVLGLHEVRPPANPATQELKEYLALVDNDQWNSPRALELREKLNARYQGNEPALLEADLRIENRKWELGE
jgi:predicted ATP-binding protein involved in virulence